MTNDKSIKSWLPLALVIIAFVALGGYYSLTIPLWEAPDEPSHFHYLRYLLEQKKLPTPESGFDTWHHPPLFYLIAALAVSDVDLSDYINWRRPNPKSFIVDQTNPTDGPPGIQLHSRRELPPYRDIPLAVHRLRWLNVLFGALAVAAAYALAQKIFPAQLWLAVGAASVVAFNPQFIFTSASLNNDAALTAAFSLGLLPAVAIVQGDYRWRQFAGLGLLTGLAILFKQSGLALVGVAGAAIMGAGWQSRSWKRLFKWSAWFGIPLALLTGPFYLRNALLYGDPFAYKMHRAVHPPTEARTLWDVIGSVKILNRLHQTFWGYFGWANLPLPEIAFKSLLLIYPLALLGLVFWGIWGRRRWAKPKGGAAPVALLLLAIAVACVIPLRYIMTFGAFGMQGRYFFPMIAALGVVVSLGFYSLLPGKWRSLPVMGLSLALFALALWTPANIIRPAYPYLGDLPAILQTRQVERADNFANVIELAGYSAGLNESDGRLKLTLFWRALGLPQQDYTIFVHLLNPADGALLSQDDRRPLDGDFPTTLWRPGDVMRTVHTLQLSEAPRPTLYILEVGLYNWKTGQRLPLFQDGQATDSAVYLEYLAE